MPRDLSVAEIDAFRKRLCRVAEKLFAEQGTQAVTMRQLAKALGVSAMTPYRYFQDKDEILAAVRTAAFDRFAGALERAAAAETSAVARARAVGRAYLDFAFGEPNAYKLMFDVNQPDFARFPELVRAGQRARKTMAGYIRELVAAGDIDGDPEVLGRVFWAMVHGLVMLQLTGRLDPQPDFSTLHRTAMQLLVRGASPAVRDTRKKERRAS